MLRTATPTHEQIAQLRHQLGFDQPLVIQYVHWVTRALRGDLGVSLVSGRRVTLEIRSQLLSTVELALAAVSIALALGLILGLLAAHRRNTWFDTLATATAVAGVSMPNFWLGLLLIFLFSFQLRLFPSVGVGGLQHLILPAATLGLGFSAVITRLTRSSLLEVLRQEYILVARGKGLPEYSVLGKHAVRNALIPVVTIVGMQLGSLIAGTVVVETVFARQGIGQLIVQGILSKDIPIVQGTVLVAALAYIVVNFLVDLSYVLLDPRIRHV
jgi:peptide/nickel transport system permease protein